MESRNAEEKYYLVTKRIMATTCKKCHMLKMTPNTPCLCNVKKFDDKKLSKHTKKEKAPTPVKQISEKRKKRLATNGTEGVLFKKIFKNLEKKQKNICAICGTRVDQEDVSPACFPHILPKGLFPAYRYFENNI